MGKKAQLRRRLKEQFELDRKKELRRRFQARLEPLKRWGLFLVAAALVSSVSVLIGSQASGLMAALQTRFESQIKGPFGEISKKELANSSQWRLMTSLGEIEIKLLVNQAPQSSANFVLLARRDFYDGIKFHRVLQDFMIQTGDPESRGEDISRYGTGGPGYSFNDELKGDESYLRGVVAMANSGPNTNGSQFFIVQRDQLDLPKNYTIFGRVTRGLEVVDKIAQVKVKKNAGGEESLPAKPVILEDVIMK